VQLDRVVRYGGWLWPSRTVSLVRDDGSRAPDGFYVIDTGPVTGEVTEGGLSGMMAEAVVDKIAARRRARMSEVEAEIRRAGAAALLGRSRRSRFIARAEIVDMYFTSVPPETRFPIVVVHAPRTITFHLVQQDERDARRFFDPLLRP
jgi:hypothetical protein